MLGLLNLYRLSIPSLLLALSLLASRPTMLGAAFPAQFYVILIAWFATGVICIGLLKTRWPTLQTQAYIHIAFDVVAVTALLLYAARGVASGARPAADPAGRRRQPAAAIAHRDHHRRHRRAVRAARSRSRCGGPDSRDASELTQAGMLGGVIFVVALAVAPLARRLRESEALVRQRDLDLANLAELSQYIVERLRESLVVVDEQDRIRLINESARQILGGEAAANALLGEVSPRLLYLLAMWRQSAPVTDTAGGNLLAADGLREVRPHFAPLGQAQAAAGAGVPRGPVRARRPHPADPARGARPPVGLHRPRDPQSRRRDQPRGAAARGGPEAVGREPAPGRDHQGQCRARQHDHRQRAAARAARDHAPGAHAARRVAVGLPRRVRRHRRPRGGPAGRGTAGAGPRGARRPLAPAPDPVESLRERVPLRGADAGGQGRGARSAASPAATGRSSRCSTAAPASTRR